MIDIKPSKSSQLEQTKLFYCQLIESLLFKSMDDLCRFDPNDVRGLITELWFEDFLPKNTHLDAHETEEIKTMFQVLIEDLETSNYCKYRTIKC